MASPALISAQDVQLEDEVAQYYADPLNYVRFAFPWGELDGPLAAYKEPRIWQCEFLEWLGGEIADRGFDGITAVPPIRGAVSSGHGAGKGALTGMLTNFIMSTRKDAKGTVTANTSTQLDDKTWAAILWWNKLSITAHWFEANTQILYRKGSRESWRVTPLTCAPENSEAFAGQHSERSTSFYINDEDSNVPETIHEVQEGGLAKGEPMYFLFGNPTRRRGAFYDAVFGDKRHRWKSWVLDVRKVEGHNAALVAEYIEDYGDESDFFRVRVMGLPPSASDAQFIDSDRVKEAQRRVVHVLPDQPLVAGCDLAWGGSDFNVIRFRRGADARSIAPIRIPGKLTADPAVLTNRLADVLTAEYDGQRVAMLFLDSAGIAGSIGARLRDLGHRNIQEVNFGADSPNPKRRFYRDHMWAEMKDWLLVGAIDKHPRLEIDLQTPGLRPDGKQRIWLESKEDIKKRGEKSPDDGDALCFVAGTLIETEHGARPIESIRVGERVVTPFGLSPVMALVESDTLALTTAIFSGGQMLVGKGEHRVFTFSRGRVRMDALSLTDEVEILSRWRLSLWRFVRLFSIGARSSGFKALVDTFNPGTPVRRRDFCIGGFGAITTALFRRVTRSTTSITTGATTAWTTLNCALRGLTSVSIWPSALATPLCALNGWNGWPRAGRVRLSGTDQRPAVNGTSLMGSVRGSADVLHPSYARDAGSSTQPFSRVVRSIARRAVSRLSHFVGISPTLVNVRTAVATSWQTAIGRRPIVPVSVRTDTAPPTRTYNLTLAEHNAYYANRILVFNCLTFAARVAPPRPAVSANMPQEYAWS